MRRRLVAASACIALAAPMVGCDCSGGDGPASTAVADAAAADAGALLGADISPYVPTETDQPQGQSGVQAPRSSLPLQGEEPVAPPVGDRALGGDYVDNLELFAQRDLFAAIPQCRDVTSYGGKVQTITVRVEAGELPELTAVVGGEADSTEAFGACLGRVFSELRMPANPRPREGVETKHGLAVISPFGDGGYEIEFRVPDAE